ncbi:unnamed protein product [Didymodactylos carnosus]|uniref:RING-type domain-containing protein n=1 Tax=Didymodactylos carnosus TaxID=1234261 RepID=A0A814IG31_9BILA|nr:unnamed protein product [Didymodactylos carnosus]CAF1023974.1 unnamed protein product [Didymodactylos carnosus]CAF3579401.1 unnamed protein product [Didymodactylos carnosus]CAF3795249.1 unnamed protein product [Didymodactylos carnosus]
MQDYFYDDYTSPFTECIVRVRGILKRITNISRATSVHNVIEALLFNTYEDDVEPSDCSLYMERDSCLFPLRHDDYIQDLYARYWNRSSEILFTLAFKRIASPSRLKQRYAQRKKLTQNNPISSTFENNHILHVSEQLRTQESFIRQQQQIISELQKMVLSDRTNSDNYYHLSSEIQNSSKENYAENRSMRDHARKSRYDLTCQIASDETPSAKQSYFTNENNQLTKSRCHSHSRSKVQFNEKKITKKSKIEELLNDSNFLKKSKVEQPSQLKSILKKSVDNHGSDGDDEMGKRLMNNCDWRPQIGTAMIRRTPKSLRRSVSIEQNMLNCEQNHVLKMLKEKSEGSKRLRKLIYETDSDNSDTGSDIRQLEKRKNLIKRIPKHDRFQNPRVLPCQHTFCKRCLEGMFDPHQRTISCPTCRRPLNLQLGIESLPTNVILNNLMDVQPVKAKCK